MVSDDAVFDVTPKVLRELRLKHPDASADVDFPSIPADIIGFSASESDMAKVLKHFAVGKSGVIDGLRLAHFRDLTSNSTAEAGQHLIRSP